VLQVAQPDHQPDRHTGSAELRMIELAEARLKPLPVDQAGQPHQLDTSKNLGERGMI
jgi:hypothetical protein